MSINTTGNDATTGQATGEPQAERTFTQQELDTIIRDRLAQDRDRQMKKLAAEYGDLEALKAAQVKLADLETAQLSEAEKLRKQLEEMQRTVAERDQAAKAAELAALRLEVGQEKGLTPTLSRRLVGATREELLADADLVLADLKPQRPTLPGLDERAGGAGDGRGSTAGLSEMERQFAAMMGLDLTQVAAQKRQKP